MIDLFKKLKCYKIENFLICCFCLGLAVTGLTAQGAPQTTLADRELVTRSSYNTISPRATIKTFLQLRAKFERAMAIYQKNPTYDNVNKMQLMIAPLFRLIDLSTIPYATKRVFGIDAIGQLLDIFGRVELPPLDKIPDGTVLKNDEPLLRWQIPQTPISIQRINKGPRAGEYLFSSNTIETAPVFYKQIEHIPLKSTLKIKSWSDTFAQFHGPLIPTKLVAIIPDSLKVNWFDTPIWKNILLIALIVVTSLVILLLNKILKTALFKHKLSSQSRFLVIAVMIILVVAFVKYFATKQIHLAGVSARSYDLLSFAMINLACGWIFWLLTGMIFEWIILSPKIPDKSLDANLLRLLAKIIGFIGVILIIAYGANQLGVPIVGLFAGVGVSSLAVALAIRPTLENLIGGFILFLDKPVKIGDFCSFGEHRGTVEKIGLRSTNIRTRARTLITVPNATFANMEIVNWANCDQMLIMSTIGLRYETDVDQLHFVLVKLREMFLAHPNIASDTVRVRFTGYGPSSLDIEIRVYAYAQEWDGFYEIREDALLRVKEIVEKSGTAFAFPSQTLYIGQDDGLDPKLGGAAIKEVEAWRKSGKCTDGKRSL